MNAATVSAAQEWKSGWTLVLACSVGFSFFSVLLSATGLFMGPLAGEFGWSRTLLSAGPSIATAVTAILSPFYGALIDRHGSRRLALPGIVLTMGAVALFSFASGSAAQWIGLWVLFGLISTSIKSTIWSAAVVGVFEKGRGLALGLTVAGTAVSQTVVPPLGNFLIGEFGWRAAFVWLGIGWGGLTLLLCWLFLFDAHDRAKARAARDGQVAAVRGAVELPGLTRAQALRDTALWRVALSTFVVMVLTIGLGIHLFPILTEAGVSRANAAWLTSLSGVAGIVGKLATGALLDRFRPNWIGGVTMGVTAVTFFLLIDGMRSPAAIICAMLVNGYAAGTKTQICGFLTVGYAGMRNFGSIYGAMSALVALASGLGPMIAGMVYDRAGGYEPFLWAGVIGCTLGGALLVSLPAYPKWEKPAAI
ncbi:MFS transporter [Novosphingobium album (ex Liu et al. 2023)]|uniref:MFS transporter n=1 Tax=Novosphingobium album (ex Liu et al. 2023) TaxID=3031130 RepID=A0ABT5WSI1_9SPHN|nr:MFS transporter [Novosphingobium album (ex Liu et al. 2023)]MDE8652706.1 MFS transporter [Novosphingobium album (ex Liu et al. 2023)]